MKPKNMLMRIIRFIVILLLLFLVVLPKAKEQVKERYDAMQITESGQDSSVAEMTTEFDDAASLSQE